MVASVVVGLLLVAACGSQDDAETAGEPGAATTTVAESTVVESDDGGLSLEIPDGALPEGTSAADITITALGAEDLPGPLAGTDLRSAFYSLEPDGLQFDEPVTLTRRFDAAGSGFDLAEGVPVPYLVLSDPAGETFEPASEQTVQVEGGEVVLSGTIEHFSFAYAFGGTLSVRIPDSAPAYVGGTTILDAEFHTNENAADLTPKVIADVIFADPGLEVRYDQVENQLVVSCQEEGVFSYGLELLVVGIGPSGDLFGLDAVEVVVFLEGEIECRPDDEEPEGSTPSEPEGVDIAAETRVASMEVCTVHMPLGGFPSRLEFRIELEGEDVQEVDHIELGVGNGANGGQPVAAPVEAGAADVDVGIPQYGPYSFDSLVVYYTDQASSDLTANAQALYGALGGVQVDAGEGCSSAP